MNVEPQTNAFSIPVRVYYEDTDAGGVVYYANYLRFFERCRTEWMRQAGHNQHDLSRDHDIAFVVRRASCDYLRPARLDDELQIGLEVERLTKARVLFRQHVQRLNADGPHEELVTGHIEIACVKLSSMTPAPIPAFLYSKLETLK